jgi:hypothetical protein
MYVAAPQSHFQGGPPAKNLNSPSTSSARYGVPQVKQVVAPAFLNTRSIDFTGRPQPTHSKVTFTDKFEEKPLCTYGSSSCKVFLWEIQLSLLRWPRFSKRPFCVNHMPELVPRLFEPLAPWTVVHSYRFEGTARHLTEFGLWANGECKGVFCRWINCHKSVEGLRRLPLVNRIPRKELLINLKLSVDDCLNTSPQFQRGVAN